MKVGLMTSGPLTEWNGQALDLDGYLSLLKAWGAETLDIFPAFLWAAPAQELRRALERHGLACACYYIAADLCAEGNHAHRAAYGSFTTGLDEACALGAPLVFTHGTQHTYAGEEMFLRYAQNLGRMAELCNQAGVTLVVENAGTLMHSTSDLLRMMDLLADAGLRLCLDTGNFHLWGQDEVTATRALLPWAVHLHVKDYVEQHWLGPHNPAATQVNLGEGDVRHRHVLSLLHQAGFQGTLAFEPHGDKTIEPGLRTLGQWLGRQG